MIYNNKISKIPTCTALLHPALLLIFKILPTCIFIPTCTIIRKTKVLYLLYIFYFLTDLNRALSLGEDSIVEFAQEDPKNASQQWIRAYDFSDGKNTTNVCTLWFLLNVGFY